jgi:hypothetical protein
MNRSIVFVVQYVPSYEDFSVEGVFTTRPRAEAFVCAEIGCKGRQSDHYVIDEVPLDRTSAELQEIARIKLAGIETATKAAEPYAYIRNARLKPIVGIDSSVPAPPQRSLIQFYNPFVESGEWPVSYALIQEAAECWTKLTKHGVPPQRAMDAIKTIIHRLRGQGTGKSTALKWLVDSVSRGEHRYTGDQLGPDTFTHTYEHNKWMTMIDQAVVLRGRRGPGYAEPDPGLGLDPGQASTNAP